MFLGVYTTILFIYQLESRTSQESTIPKSIRETLPTSHLRARSNKVVEVVAGRRGGVVKALTSDCGDSLTVSDDGTRHASWSVGDLELGQATLDREGLGVGSRSEGDLSRTSGEDDCVHVVVSPVPSGRLANVVGGVGIVRVGSRPHDERVFRDGRVLTSLERSRVVLGQDIETLVVESVGPDFGSSGKTTVNRANVG